MTTAPLQPLRIGILGASRIADVSIVKPASATGHRLVAVAARDYGRARQFAAQHGVERVHESYDDLLADPDIEVVYNPLANALHGPWNLRAIAAGKHVLADKPFASNATEARQVAAAAEAAGVVVLEAFHYPFHPLFQRACALLEEGAVGEIRHVDAVLRMPAPPDSDPRWSLELAGGAAMDLGCYSLHAIRQLGLRFLGGEPTVLSAMAVTREGRPGWTRASLWSCGTHRALRLLAAPTWTPPTCGTSTSPSPALTGSCTFRTTPVRTRTTRSSCGAKASPRSSSTSVRGPATPTSSRRSPQPFVVALGCPTTSPTRCRRRN